MGSALYSGSWTDYLWIVVVGALTCFASAWSIGANDVANAFGTSVGSKTLTLAQACLIAVVFEFTGAITLGAAVTSTISGSIAKVDAFLDYPEIYMYGMLCSMAAATIWVTLATYLELAVSTTHSTIGAVMGFALVWNGTSAIVWDAPTSTFPYRKGLVPIIISWFFSPVIAAMLAAAHFLTNRWTILRRPNSTQLAFWALPLLAFKTVVIDLFFILSKGAGTSLDWSTQQCAWVSAVSAVGVALLTAAIGLPLLHLHFKKQMENQDAPRFHMQLPQPPSPPPALKFPADSVRELPQKAGADPHPHQHQHQHHHSISISQEEQVGEDHLCSHGQQQHHEGSQHHHHDSNHSNHDSNRNNHDSNHDSNRNNHDSNRNNHDRNHNHDEEPHAHHHHYHKDHPEDKHPHPHPHHHHQHQHQHQHDSRSSAGICAASGVKLEEGGGAGAGGGKPDGGSGKPTVAVGAFIAGPPLPPPPCKGSAQAVGVTQAEHTTTLVGLWDAAIARASLASFQPSSSYMERVRQWGARAWKWQVDAVTHGLRQDLHENLEDDERVVQMHQAAEVFEPQTEQVYKYLQVFSACCVSFAHGSNDVANAVGPFAGIWYVYNNWNVSASGIDCPKWILAMGGAGIVLGLSTYGYNIIRALGMKMARMSPSRGYCAELATAFTVAIASACGMPVSTTHCIVGAEVGVGMCENIKTGANWRLFAKTATSWVATLLVAGVLSAALFAQGAYSPNIIQSRQIHSYEHYISGLVARNWALVNASNAVSASTLGSLDQQLSQLTSASLARLRLLDLAGHVQPADYTDLLTISDTVLKQVSMVAVGYNTSNASFTHLAAAAPALPRT